MITCDGDWLFDAQGQIDSAEQKWDVLEGLAPLLVTPPFVSGPLGLPQSSVKTRVADNATIDAATTDRRAGREIEGEAVVSMLPIRVGLRTAKAFDLAASSRRDGPICTHPRALSRTGP